MRSLSTLASYCFFLLLAIAPPALASERVALVIGNSEYGENMKLENPGNDADLMAEKLAELGFKVIKVKDQDSTGMEDAVFEFADALEEDGLGLFYYAGHGMQIDGVNYLLPVKTQFRAAAEVKRRGLPVDMLLDVMNESKVALKVVILDCCRDNPFARGWRSTAGRGLSTMTPPNGSIIAFSTAPGQTASDGSGGNSPYTKEIAYALSQRPAKGLELKQIFFIAGPRVKKSTGQVPWVNMESSLGEYFLTDGTGAPPSPGKISGGSMDDQKYDNLSRQNQELKNDLEELKEALAKLTNQKPEPAKPAEIQPQNSDRVAAAEDENERLKQELDSLKKLIANNMRPPASTISPGSNTSRQMAGTPREIGETVEESLKAFVNAHIAASAGNDAAKWAGMFTANPNYCYAPGRTSRSFLTTDRNKLIQKYPSRIMSLRNGVQITELDGGRNARVSLIYDYKYYGRSKNASGACREDLMVTWFEDRWLITDFDEQVIRD